jgi:hypothetical protein
MIFKYQLTKKQHSRFVNDPNTTGEIDNLGRVLGVDVKDGPDKGTSWVFSGRCAGTARLADVGSTNWLLIELTKKPWWLPAFVLDFGFREALK